MMKSLIPITLLLLLLIQQTLLAEKVIITTTPEMALVRKEKFPEGVFCQITENNLETGLRGYPVGYCTTSLLNSKEGVFYIRKPVAELAYREPEEVIYLLYHGKEGSASEISLFFNDIKQRSFLSNEVLQAIRALPRQGDPMKLFASALLICGMLEGQNDYYQDSLNVIAKAPLLAAAVINHHAGWDMPDSQPHLGYMENFYHLLSFNNPDLLTILKCFNILHYDHGGGNLSTFVGKAVSSGLEDMFGSLAAAMCALEGPLHGNANRESLAFVQQILDCYGTDLTEYQLEEFLYRKLSNKELIFGFGHAVLRAEDPRASVLYDLSMPYISNPLVKTALLLRKKGSEVLKEIPKISDPFPNVDAISGILLMASGFPHPAYYTVLFGMSRLIGISTQILYERTQAREGKGVPLYRPKYIYKDKILI